MMKIIFWLLKLNALRQKDKCWKGLKRQKKMQNFPVKPEEASTTWLIIASTTLKQPEGLNYKWLIIASTTLKFYHR